MNTFVYLNSYCIGHCTKLWLNYIFFLNLFIFVNYIFMVVVFYVIGYFNFEMMLFMIQDSLVHKVTVEWMSTIQFLTRAMIFSSLKQFLGTPSFRSSDCRELVWGKHLSTAECCVHEALRFSTETVVNYFIFWPCYQSWFPDISNLTVY
jgi:hypothetical protein